MSNPSHHLHSLQLTSAHSSPLQQELPGWRSQSKGTFLFGPQGDIIKKFQQRHTFRQFVGKCSGCRYSNHWQNLQIVDKTLFIGLAFVHLSKQQFGGTVDSVKLTVLDGECMLFGRGISDAARMILTVLMPVLLILPGAASSEPSAEIEHGFRLMYNLNFSQAEREFSAFEQQHRDNPMGPVSEATGMLFSEFQRLGVLETQFYENDSVFAARKKLTADPTVRDRFNLALTQAEKLANERLAKNSTDHDALFALTLASGL